MTPPATRNISPIDVNAIPDLDSESFMPLQEKRSNCQGLIIKLPPGQSPHSAYPFGLHDELGDPWDYAVANGTLVLRAQRCLQRLPRTDKNPCSNCEVLEDNPNLQGVLDRIEEGIHENSRLVYNDVGGLIENIRRKNWQIKVLQREKFNDAWKLVSQVTALDNNKEWIMAIGSGKVEQMERLVKAALANKQGVCGMLQMYDQAAQSVFKMRNYTEEDKLHSLLLWHLAGARVAGIAH